MKLIYWKGLNLLIFWHMIYVPACSFGILICKTFATVLQHVSILVFSHMLFFKCTDIYLFFMMLLDIITWDKAGKYVTNTFSLAIFLLQQLYLVS